MCFFLFFCRLVLLLIVLNGIEICVSDFREFVLFPFNRTKWN